MDSIDASLRASHQALLERWDKRDAGSDASPTQQVRRLARSRVMLLAAGPLGLQAAANLIGTPLGALTLCGLHEPDRVALAGLLKTPGRRARECEVMPTPFEAGGLSVSLSEHHLFVVATGRPHPLLLERINRSCLRAETAWIHSALWGAWLTVGPTFMPGLTACYECYARRVRSNAERPEAADATDTFLRHDLEFEFKGQLRPLIRLAASYVTGETVRFLGGTPEPFLLGRVLRWHALSQEHVSDFVPRLEWCPHCFQPGVDAVGDTLESMMRRNLQRRGEA